jgi:hypothetical protein
MAARPDPGRSLDATFSLLDWLCDLLVYCARRRAHQVVCVLLGLLRRIRRRQLLEGIMPIPRSRSESLKRSFFMIIS